MPTAPACRASWCGWCAMSKLPEPLDGLALKGIPKEPLAEFLADRGSRRCSTRLKAAAQRSGRSSSGGGINGVMTALDRKPAAARAGPSRSRSTGPSTRRSPTKPRSTAGSPKRRRRVTSRSTPRPTASTASSPGWRASASRLRRTGPATSRSAIAARTCCRTRPNQMPQELVLREAQAAAGGSGGPEDRA